MRNSMRPEPYRVMEIHHETADTATFTLEPAEGGMPFYFAPGQFNMLYVFGIGEVPISICGSAHRPDILVHTVREVGMVTKALVTLKKGAVIGVRGPFGSAWPVELTEGKDLVLVAGGLGLPPLRPVIYEVLENRHKFNKVTLLYGARTPPDLLYRDELEKWRGRFDFEVGVTVDRPVEAYTWHGQVGVVPGLIKKADFDPANTIAMVCGPEIMMRFAVPELEKRGLASSNIFLSMERNMKCAIGLCGHCQWGPQFVCKDGPIFSYQEIRDWFVRREV